MITDHAIAWGLAAVAFALCAGCAAWGVERVLVARRSPRRHPWVIALLLALLWPPMAYVVTTRAPEPVIVELVSSPISASPTPDAMVLPTPEVPAPPPAWWLFWTWGIMSMLVALHAWRGWRTLDRERDRAEACWIEQVRVYRTQRVGPAVFGLRQPVLLMPAWVWELEPPLQSLVLRHEQEHCRAGDAWLVWLTVLSRVLMPWNPAVWWLGRRVRLALEMDCDARTVRDDAEQGVHYARLLLLITQLRQRAQARAAHFAVALLPLPSHLHRRINAMHTSNNSFGLAQRIIAFALVGVAGLTACSRQIAGNLAGPANAPAPVATRDESQTETAEQRAVVGASTATDKPYFDFQVEQPATSVREESTFPAYPPALRAAKVTGVVLAQFVVGVDGTVEPSSARVLRTSQPEFGAAVMEALPGMRFRPATIGGRAVRQLVQQPFTFTIDDIPAPSRDSLSAKENRARPTPRTDAASGDTSVRFDFQVERPAIMAPNSVGPAYPAALRSRGVEGAVLAQFVVEVNGSVDAASIRIVESDHEEFAQAVRDALGRMRFLPATIEGRAVRQLMQQPFQFSLQR